MYIKSPIASTNRTGALLSVHLALALVVYAISRSLLQPYRFQYREASFAARGPTNSAIPL